MSKVNPNASICIFSMKSQRLLVGACSCVMLMFKNSICWHKCHFNLFHIIPYPNLSCGSVSQSLTHPGESPVVMK